MSAHAIAFLGPQGTYCNEAANLFAQRLGLTDVELVAFSSFDEVFAAVDRGKCEYGVVGKENSLEGPVTATLDNFAFSSKSHILGETVINVHHCLLLHPDARLEDVRTVASHPQGLAQCRRFIQTVLPGRGTVSTSSTAESARLAAGDPTVAGIANAYAASLYGARVANEEIEDRLGNQTLFALIGRPGSAPQLQGGRRKTSVALFLEADKPGALHMILSEFAYAGISLTMIQSRPTKQQLGDYMFFIEFEGSTMEPAVQTALNCLRMKLREVKVLGSYPIVE